MRNTPHYAIIKYVIRLQCNLFLPDANNFLGNYIHVGTILYVTILLLQSNPLRNCIRNSGTVSLAIVYRQADIHCSLTRELCEVPPLFLRKTRGQLHSQKHK